VDSVAGETYDDVNPSNETVTAKVARGKKVSRYRISGKCVPGKFKQVFFILLYDYT